MKKAMRCHWHRLHSVSELSYPNTTNILYFKWLSNKTKKCACGVIEHWTTMHENRRIVEYLREFVAEFKKANQVSRGIVWWKNRGSKISWHYPFVHNIYLYIIKKKINIKGVSAKKSACTYSMRLQLSKRISWLTQSHIRKRALISELGPKVG
jgi:hypothetical protein